MVCPRARTNQSYRLLVRTSESELFTVVTTRVGNYDSYGYELILLASAPCGIRIAESPPAGHSQRQRRVASALRSRRRPGIPDVASLTLRLSRNGKVIPTHPHPVEKIAGCKRGKDAD